MEEPSPGEALQALIRTHGLSPHPEGGYFREIHRSTEEVTTDDGRRRQAVSVILFLIPGGIHTRWHRVSSCEIWHYLAGDPISLSTGQRQAPEVRLLGPEPGQGVAVVAAGDWQRARSGGTFSLASCTVAPAFDFRDFTLEEEEPPSS